MKKDIYWSYIANCILNTFFSYTAITMNIITIYAVIKTSSLPKPFKTLLLSLAVSDLGVGLLVQPLYIVLRIMDLNLTDTNSTTIFKIYVVPTNLFCYASLFSVTALSADRFLAIHLHLRYSEIATHKRVVTVTISFWLFSFLLSMIRLWIPVEIMYVIFAIIEAGCIITGIFFNIRTYLAARGHLRQIQSLQVQVASHNSVMANGPRMRKFGITAIYVYLLLVVCYLPNICILYVGTITSEIKTNINVISRYTLTLVFLNSSLPCPSFVMHFQVTTEKQKAPLQPIPSGYPIHRLHIAIVPQP